MKTLDGPRADALSLPSAMATLLQSASALRKTLRSPLDRHECHRLTTNTLLGLRVFVDRLGDRFEPLNGFLKRMRNLIGKKRLGVRVKRGLTWAEAMKNEAKEVRELVKTFEKECEELAAKVATELKAEERQCRFSFMKAIVGGNGTSKNQVDAKATDEKTLKTGDLNSFGQSEPYGGRLFYRPWSFSMMS
jgi:hypothetical protein